MISKIRLVNCVPYRNATIEYCKKVNFIFGPNGSGKSTISAFMSGSVSDRFGESTIEWEGPVHEEVCVYDREFRRMNFQQEIRGIFTMGSATIDEIRELDDAKERLRRAEDELSGKARLLEKLETERGEIEGRFREDAWSHVLKKNARDFQFAFEGLRNSKAKFVSELKLRIAGRKGLDGHICERQDLVSRAEALYSSGLSRCERLEVSVAELVRLMDEVRGEPVWSTAIVGSDDVDIAGLIRELGNSAWVNQGRKYLLPGSKTCPFCQQETVTEGLLTQLEAFFDREYQARVEAMKVHLANYREAARRMVGEFERAIRMDGAVDVGEIDVDLYRTRLDLLRSVCADGEAAMQRKIDDPSLKVELPDVGEAASALVRAIDSANASIDARNELVDHRQVEQEALIEDVWATLIAENDSIVKAYQRDLRNKEKAILGVGVRRDEAAAEVDCLRREVTERGSNVTSVQPAIDEINRSLEAYGFTSFRIVSAVKEKNCYCIVRDDGTLVENTLSEGEETFLTFLYFMERIKGSTERDGVAQRKVVVIDDPICSLDSTVLYVVSAMIKDLCRRVRDGDGDVTQLFVLTHNVFFHKEASFVDGRTRELADVNYWMISKRDGVSDIRGYGMRNPVSTTYELLWRELCEDAGSSLVSVQNAMRRIIENYFGMMGKKPAEILTCQFDTVEDRMIADSLFYWMNDGSHSIPDDLYIDSYSDAVLRYRRVFREVFERSGHGAHYNMMMRDYGVPASEEG